MNLFRLALAGIAVAAITAATGCDQMSSTVSGKSGKKLTLVSLADQTVRQGDANKLGVTIVRQDFDSVVTISIADLPSGVSVAGGSNLEIPKGSLKMDSMTLVAARDAAVVKDHRVAVTAKGPDGISVTEYFNLTVEARN